MKALANMSRLQVSSDFLLLLLKVYESKGKEFYYDELFEKDADVFKKKTIEDNVYYVGKLLELNLTDARLKLLAKKKLLAKNKMEVLLQNLKIALTSLQKHPKDFEVLPNEFDELARVIAKDYEPIKFIVHESKGDGTLINPKKKSTSRDVLEEITLEYAKQTKTKQYELTQLISNFYVDFMNSNIFTTHNDVIGYVILYAFLLKDFNVFKYVSFFEYFYKSFENFKLALNQANYYWSTGYANTELLTRFLVELLNHAYLKVDQFSKEYSFEKKMNKSDNIESSIRHGAEIFSKDELRILHPTVALITIDRTLKRLKDEGLIQPLGKGRSSKWQRLDENKRKGSKQLDIFQFTD